MICGPTAQALNLLTFLPLNYINGVFNYIVPPLIYLYNLNINYYIRYLNIAKIIAELYNLIIFKKKYFIAFI